MPGQPKSAFMVAAVAFALTLSSFASMPVFAAPIAASGTSNSHILPLLVTSKQDLWAGYGVVSPTSGVVTMVEASFTQPKITCNSGLGSSQIVFLFAVLDGVTSGGDSEYLGTAAECGPSSAKPTYFEAASATMSGPLTIKPGHVYSAVISESGGTFSYTFKDVTKGLTSTGVGFNANALLNAASCVAIRAESGGGVLSPLANFTKMRWGFDNTKVANTCDATVSGVTGAFGTFASPIVVVKYVMYNAALTVVDATPSALSKDGSSFKLVWKAYGP